MSAFFSAIQLSKFRLNKFVPIFIFLNLFQTVSLGQNAFDPYLNYSGQPVSIVPPHAQAMQGFNGEYQVFPTNHHWNYFRKYLSGYQLKHTIQPVSFPFIPECPPGECQNSSSTTKNFVIPSQSSFSQTGWGIQVPLQPFLILSNYFSEVFPPGNADGVKCMLASGLIHSTLGVSRTIFPHTILKHTLVLECNGIPVDSFSFVMDHTRGRMRHYPFKSNNGNTSAPEHDIVLFPYFTFPNQISYNNPPVTGNFLNTPNLYPPKFQSNNSCINFAPANPSEWSFPKDTFAYPPPYSLPSFLLGHGTGQHFAGYIDSSGLLVKTPGEKHNYKIDRPIDLAAVFKFREKVVYNPSEVTITNNVDLVFPSGFTFKTVHGIFPSQQLIQANDPASLYNNFLEIPISSQFTLSDDPHTPIDERLSYYYVSPGSKLRIQPCVTIMDAVLKTLGPGAVIELDTNQTNGNYVIDNSLGGTINYVTYPISSPDCAFRCYDASFYDAIDVLINNVATDPGNPVVWSQTSLPILFPTSANNTVKIAKTLRITGQSTLIIKPGIRLEFGPMGKIIIEPGGKLWVQATANNRASITSACQLMWQGIEVLGTTSKSQYPIVDNPFMGFLQLDYCDVSNARTAVSVLKRTDPVNFNGGIVRLTHSRFTNNYKGIEFGSFKHFNVATQSILDNASLIQNCIFETTDFLLDDAYQVNGEPRAAAFHISLWNVKNVGIRSCQFKCNPNLFKPHLRGTGIYALDAGFKLNPTLPCHFENLTEGVWAMGLPLSVDFIKIDGATFNNNIHALVLEGTRYSEVLRCNFTVPPSPRIGYTPLSLEKGFDKPVGIYTIGAYDFKIYENSINEFSNIFPAGDLSCDSCSYGIVINRSNRDDINGTGLGAGLVYKNKIFRTSVGIQAEGNNGMPQDSFGVDIKCNEFLNHSLFDWTSTGRMPTQSTPGITGSLKNQGSCITASTQAGNKFDPACTGNNEMLFLVTQNTNQFTYSDQPSFVPSSNCTNNNNLNPCQITLGNNSCPFVTQNPCPLPCISIGLDSSKSTLRILLNQYQNLIDGGNTSAVINYINGSSSPGNLKNYLFQRSPYLSDTVLISYLNKFPVQPPGHIKQIIIENSPVTSKVWSKFTQLNLPLGIVQEVLAHQRGISPRAEKENEIIAQNSIVMNWENDLIRYCLDNNIIDTAISIIKDSAVSSLHQILPLVLEERKLGYADSLIYELDDRGCDYGCNFCDNAKIKLELLKDSLSWKEMNQQQYQQISQLAISNFDFAINSRVALRILAGREYSREPYGLPSNSIANHRIANTLEFKETKQSKLLISPNPAQNFFELTCITTENNYPLFVDIFSSTGEKLHDTRFSNGEYTLRLNCSFAPGLYFVVCVLSSGENLSGKLIISNE